MVSDAGQGDAVDLMIVRTVKSPGEEVCPAVFLKQPALCHLDARGSCHERVSVLDPAVIPGLTGTHSSSWRDPVKLDDILLIPFGDFTLTGDDMIVLVDRDNRFGNSAACRHTQAENVEHRFCFPVIGALEVNVGM
jgi:hypothetical protein